MNNKTYKLTDVKQLLIEGVEQVNANMWTNFIKHTKAIEDKFSELDEIVNDLLSTEVDSVTMTIGDTSSDSSTESN